MTGQKTAIKNCDKCLHKSVCILYHGHGQIELRFGKTYKKDPDKFVDRLDHQLARQCRFYLDKPQAIRTADS